MKKTLFAVVGMLLAFPAFGQSYSLTTRDWRLTPQAGGTVDKAALAYGFDDSSWLARKLPGQWQQVPQFKDYGGNMLYRYKFEFNPVAGRAYYLRFNGVFYRANLWLNGYYLGRHAGYFDPFEYDVTFHLRDKNVLVAQVICPFENNKGAKTQITGVFGNWDLIAANKNPGGIWREVEIVEAGTARFRRLWLGTQKLEGDNARVRLYGEMRSLPLAREPYTITLDLEPEIFPGKAFHLEFGLTGEPGRNYFKKEFTLEKPALWNTWDRGKPNLYQVTVKAVLNGRVQDEQRFITGIRTIEKQCPARKIGDYCWEFVLNGKPIYIRGNNYAPSDVYLAAATAETITKDAQMMKDSYYNMVRVHAHIDRPEFYEAMDRAGIMVFQDFPLQWGYSETILDDAKLQVQEMVWLLGSHPSIALWCCHNEPGKANLKKLDPALKKIIEFTDSTRPVNLASGPGKAADAHHYEGWYTGTVDGFAMIYSRPFQQRPVFITEFGAQAFPDYDNAVKFMDPEINKIDWKKLETENLLQKKIMDRRVPIQPGMDLKTYVQATQDYQARLLKFHVDFLRAKKYSKNFGIMPFCYNDPQPGIVWSVVDYWREPKQGYFAVRQSFQPVYAFAAWQFKPYKRGRKITMPIYLVNDLLQEYEGIVKVEVTHHGKIVAARSFAAEAHPDMPAARIGEVPLKFEKPGDYIAKITLEAQGLEKPVENVTVLKVK